MCVPERAFNTALRHMERGGFLEPNLSGLLPMVAFSNVYDEACLLHDMGKTSGVSTHVGNAGSHNAKQVSSHVSNVLLYSEYSREYIYSVPQRHLTLSLPMPD